MAKSNIFKRIIKYISDPEYRFNVNKRKFGCYDHLSDEKYLKKYFKAVFGYELDLDNPKTYNEKLQWLKLYDRKPLYTKLVDKYLVREFIKEKIGEEYLIPLLGVYERAEDIDFDALPNEFVLKCNHNSGGLFICKDKSKLTPEKIAEVREKLDRSLKCDYYLQSREWPYKDVPRRIIAEQYMVDEKDGSGLTDYKIFCFKGEADCVMICLDRFTGDTKFYFFDKNWELKKYNQRGLKATDGFTIEKPAMMSKMFELAGILSQDIPFVRVDFYQSSGKVFFGEMTFFPQSGFDKNLTAEAERYFGEKIIFSDKNIQHILQ